MDGLLGQSMLLLAAALLALSPTTHARQALDKSTIVIGTELDYPPYSFTGDDARPTGFNVELTQAIAEIMGLEAGDWREEGNSCANWIGHQPFTSRTICLTSSAV